MSVPTENGSRIWGQFRGAHLMVRVVEAERTGAPDVCAAGRGLFHRCWVEALHSTGAARLRAGLRVLVFKHELSTISSSEQPFVKSRNDTHSQRFLLTPTMS